MNEKSQNILDNIPDDYLEFQISDWNSYHDASDSEFPLYTIQIFGRTMDDHDVCIKVTDFQPCFYIEIPPDWNNNHVKNYINHISARVKYRSSNDWDNDVDLSKTLIMPCKEIRAKKFYGFNAGTPFRFLRLQFNNLDGMKMYEKTMRFPNKNAKYAEYVNFVPEIYESNIEPHIRLIHVQEISPSGWVKIPKSKLEHIPEYSFCDYSFATSYVNIGPAKNNERMSPLIIMGYDIECISCDERFPMSSRLSDKIIQIGITLYRYGSMQCYQEYLLTMKKCQIPGAKVKCYKTEKGLLRGFANIVSEIRPDYIAGYNNFGFDDLYIYERAKRLDQEQSRIKCRSVEALKKPVLKYMLNRMGKLNNEHIMYYESLKNSLTTFEVKNLSSSALGDNVLQFFRIPGVVSVDMMKTIQRMYGLPSYKLDYVASVKIKESILNIIIVDQQDDKLTVDIVTRNTKALDPESYIQILVDDGYSPTPLADKSKYFVESITPVAGSSESAIRVKMKNQDYQEYLEFKKNKTIKFDWAFAKDDLHHSNIRKYFQDGSPDKIAQIGKYCIKDCKLVNLLMAKEDIIVGSVGMAHVCNVPVSYLFLRGQGVKIFSLVSKRCREMGYLMPVMRRKRSTDEDEEEESYEGAVVIKPIPGLYRKPIGVLDFNSLYPNSMREVNTSHECYVSDPAFDNLPGYHYHQVDIPVKDSKGRNVRNPDGTLMIQHHRFAQKIVTSEEIRAEMANFNESVYLKRDTKIAAIAKMRQFTPEYFEDKTLAKIMTLGEDKLQGTRIAEIAAKISKITPPDQKQTCELLAEYGINRAERACLTELANVVAEDEIKFEESRRYNVVDGKRVKYGILCEILTDLLNKRKDVNAVLATKTDASEKAILNSLQLAYKVTANSLYGQTGAPTSPIFFMAIAASTTAIGRKRLYFAKDTVESNFPGSEIVYGDTDSIFINFNARDAEGKYLEGKEALAATISLCKEAANLINRLVPKPQAIVYEKTYFPWFLLSKKKYTGYRFENDVNKFFLHCMGIVLKRRDNAPIVKIFVGTMLKALMDGAEPKSVLGIIEEIANKMFNNEYSIDKFILSKSLRANYANPESIAHKVLADRIGERDPGNKPQINDRIAYVFIRKRAGSKKDLQSDQIETPEYVLANKLQIDYIYYLEHQVINPVCQFLDLIMDKRHSVKLFERIIGSEKMRLDGRVPIYDLIMKNEGKKELIAKMNDVGEYINKDRYIPTRLENSTKLKCHDITAWTGQPQGGNKFRTTTKGRKKPAGKAVGVQNWFKK